MGLLQKAVETYDAHQDLVGVEREGHQMLAPIAHTVTGADIEITLDRHGCFRAARLLDKEESKTVIPVTEESAGRVGSKPVPHPLCDQLGYVSSLEPEKKAAYLEQLSAWKESPYSHPIPEAVYAYVSQGTILDDLQKAGISTEKNKQLIRWRINGIFPEVEECWKNTSLFIKYTQWYLEKKDAEEKELCIISGRFAPLAASHPKSVVPIHGNAKIISSNDTSNFTYRGRFLNDGQAASIGFEASQKAHNALRWLVAEQGVQVVFGKRTFLCWNPQGTEIHHPARPFRKRATVSKKPSDYREQLMETLLSYKSNLPEQTAGVVIAAFDAATSGRLAVTYYNELMASDFLQRLHDWDEHCCWWYWDKGADCRAIRSPALLQIVNCAFGTQREEKGVVKLVTDDKVLRQQMQRLIACRVDSSPFPSDIERLLVERASNPQSYDSGVHSQILNTACAVIKKYYYDRKKEELSMALEKERKDRSYQFGRLLAVYEKVERDTFSETESREPNAIRLQSAFCRQPMHMAAEIEKQLERAYFPRLSVGTRKYYKMLISQIMEIISSTDEKQLNAPLGDTYLLGYYLQRNALYTKKTTEKTEEEENA